MKSLVGMAALISITLAGAGCAAGHPASSQPSSTVGTKTNAIQLRETTYGPLPSPLRNLIHSTVKTATPDGPITEIDVYGPDSRTAPVKASSGDVVLESAAERKDSFYLLVLRGHFVCDGCSGPPGHKPPRGTIETRVWSAKEGGVDFGISSSLPAAMSRLHRLAVITLS